MLANYDSLHIRYRATTYDREDRAMAADTKEQLTFHLFDPNAEVVGPFARREIPYPPIRFVDSVYGVDFFKR